MRIGNVEQYRKFYVKFLNHTVKIQDEHLQKTRTRELYSREHLSDDGDVTSGGGPDGEHRRRWLKFIAWDDLEYFPARAIVDHRPFEALWVQEGLIDNHPFIIVF